MIRLLRYVCPRSLPPNEFCFASIMQTLYPTGPLPGGSLIWHQSKVRALPLGLAVFAPSTVDAIGYSSQLLSGGLGYPPSLNCGQARSRLLLTLSPSASRVRVGPPGYAPGSPDPCASRTCRA